MGGGGGGGSAAGLRDGVLAGIMCSGPGAAEGEFITAKTSVWWDIENCPVPKGCDTHTIAKNISSALADMGYKGIVSSISAYGDTSKIKLDVQQALNSTGVSLHHIPTGAKDASDKKILVDMLFWAIDNPRPANYLLISGDRDFSNALHQLQRRRYNILLAHAPNVSPALVTAAKCVWLWTSLLSGGLPLNQLSQSSGAEASRVVVSERKQPIDPPKSSQSPMNTQGHTRSDKRPKGKQNCKATNNLNLPSPEKHGSNSKSSDKLPNTKHFIPQENKIFYSEASSTPLGSMQPKGTPMPVPEVPPEPGRTQPNLYTETSCVREAPHKFFCAVDGTTSSSTMTSLSSSIPNGPSNYQSCPPQLLKPSDLRPLQSPFMSTNLHELGMVTKAAPSFSENSYSQPLNYSGSQFNSLPGTSLPDVNMLNISERPGGVNCYNLSYHSNQETKPIPISYPSSSTVNTHQSKVIYSFPNGPEFNTLPTPTINRHVYDDGTSRMPAPAQPSNQVQFHIGNILRALHILRTDKIAPLQEHIADCICYGEINLPHFDVGLGLDHAMRYNVIEKLTLGSSLPLYVRKKDRLWDCVNIMASKKHPKAVWDAIQAFLTSSHGRSAILTTECRYQAAIVLKKNCFEDRVMGEVLQILHSLINKKWLLPYSSGWQPLSIKLPMPFEA